MQTMRVLVPLLGVFAIASACGDDGSPAAESSSDGDETVDTSSPSTSVSASTTLTSTTSDESSSESGTASSAASSDEGSSSSTGGSSSADSSGSETGAQDVEVTIAFAAEVAGVPFACGQSYPEVGSSAAEVEPRDLRFFVQDLALVRADDDTVVPVELELVDPWQAEGVALIDFEDGTGACSEGGGNPATRTEITGTVPPGEYDGVVFTVGVPEELNHADPLFAPSPLGATSMTWGWLYGYKFLKVEMQQVVEEGELAGLGVFHLGSNDCSGNPGVGDVTCALANRAEVSLDGFDAASNTIVLDVAALFADTDLAIDSQCHSFQATCPPLFDRSGIDFDTGLPTPTQVVFGVE